MTVANNGYIIAPNAQPIWGDGQRWGMDPQISNEFAHMHSEVAQLKYQVQQLTEVLAALMDYMGLRKNEDSSGA